MVRWIREWTGGLKSNPVDEGVVLWIREWISGLRSGPVD